VCSWSFSFISAWPERAADGERSRLSEDGGVGMRSVSATVRRARSSVGGRRDRADEAGPELRRRAFLADFFGAAFAERRRAARLRTAVLAAFRAPARAPRRDAVGARLAVLAERRRLAAVFGPFLAVLPRLALLFAMTNPLPLTLTAMR
jgi:hypothetical protein